MVEVEEVPGVGREDALVGEIVDGLYQACAAQLGVEGRGRTQHHRRERRLPVVAVHDVRGRPEQPQPLERCSAEEREALRIVGIVRAPLAVQPVAVEVARGVQQERRHPCVGDPEDVGGLEVARDGRPDAADPLDRSRHAPRVPVGWQDDGDLDTERCQRFGKGCEHVRQAAGLGVGEGLGGQHADAHVVSAGQSAVSRRKRAASSGGSGFTENPLPRSAPISRGSVGVISTCQW